MSGERRGRFDLHVHTSASDGLLSPAEVVDIAAARGLAGIGIADHDTVAGIGPALARARERAAAGEPAPEVVPAVEINTDFGAGEIHVLGYFIDWEGEELAGTLARLRDGRLVRVEKMLRKLRDLGVILDRDRVISLREEGSVGRPHVARAMVEAGYVRSLAEAFENYLVRGRPAYVERMRFTPAEAVQAVIRAGGVAVLAHPAGAVAPALLRDLAAAGLDGIEVCHPEHDPRQEQFYRAAAAELGLAATGGSDSHGPGFPFGADIGAYTIGADVVDELRRRRNERTRKGAIRG